MHFGGIGGHLPYSRWRVCCHPCVSADTPDDAHFVVRGQRIASDSGSSPVHRRRSAEATWACAARGLARVWEVELDAPDGENTINLEWERHHGHR